MKKVLNNIRQFKLLRQGGLLTISDAYEIFIDGINVGTIEDAYDIFECEDYIVVREKYNNSTYVLKNNQLRGYLLGRKDSLCVISNKYAILENDDGKNEVYDLASEAIIFSDNYFGTKLLGDFVVGPSAKKIICTNIHNRSKDWQFSIQDFPPYINGFSREQEADIQQIIGVYNNILWVHIGGWHLVGLDIETGKKVHHIEDLLDWLGMEQKDKADVNLNDTIHLDEQEGMLKFFAHRFYIEIDLNTLKGSIKKDFGAKWNPDWRIRLSNYYPQYPNLLFFCGYCESWDVPNAYGIFDTNKAEIVWYETTKDDLGYFYNPPQANEKLFAILDDKQNLLIYER